MMRSLFKSTFVWQFTAGFALGAIGMVTLTPADSVAGPLATARHAAR